MDIDPFINRVGNNVTIMHWNRHLESEKGGQGVNQGVGSIG